MVAQRHVPWALAMGYGARRLFLTPSLDMVVITAGLYGHPLQATVGEVVLRRYTLTAALDGAAAGANAAGA